MEQNIQNPNPNITEINKAKMIKIMSQGTYGCIYRPGFSCTGQTLSTDKYITKIQKQKSTSVKETQLGQIIINKVPHFDKYFAPVIESCDISIATIDNEEIKKCDFIKKDSENKTAYESRQYQSNKIKYVGEDTLAKYLLKTYIEKPKIILKNIVKTQKYLLDSIKILYDAGIVHLDLKENNIIMYKTDIPIIIDFGLSYNIETVASNNYKDVFFTFGPDYGPWCIDICTITGMVNSMGNEWQTKKVISAHIIEVLDEFFTKNSAMLDLLDSKERTIFKRNLYEYFNKINENNDKTWKDILDELLKYQNTWDNYSIAVIFLYLLKGLKLDSKHKQFIKINEYIILLKSIITSLPNERLTPEDTKIKLKQIFKKVEREPMNNLRKLLNTESKQMENQEQIKSNIMNNALSERTQEQSIYAKL